MPISMGCVFRVNEVSYQRTFTCYALNAPTYSAAPAAAATVEAFLARHLAEATAQGERTLAPLPDAEAVAEMLDAAFWASLRREEGRTPRISLAFVPPDL